MTLVRRFRNAVPATVKSRVKISRADAARRLGSDRWQKPALNGLDERMLAVLPPSGTFLEIGANDGYSQSNTYYLEKHLNWRGVLIEPLPSQFRLARSHRRGSTCFNMACVGPSGPSYLDLSDDNLMTKVSSQGTKTVRAKTATISSLIDASGLGRVTFMSIDVEGAELDVLAGLDLKRHTPDFLLIETADSRAVSDALRPHLHLREKLSFHDYVFVKD